MNLLSGYYSKGIEGSIELNGAPITASCRRKIAYVSQVPT
jgi:hypothetical protein